MFKLKKRNEKKQAALFPKCLANDFVQFLQICNMYVYHIYIYIYIYIYIKDNNINIYNICNIL